MRRRRRTEISGEHPTSVAERFEIIETTLGEVSVTSNYDAMIASSSVGTVEFEWGSRFRWLRRSAVLVGSGVPNALVKRRGLSLWYPSRALAITFGDNVWRWQRRGLFRHVISHDGRLLLDYGSKAGPRFGEMLTREEVLMSIACWKSGIDTWTINPLEKLIALVVDGL